MEHRMRNPFRILAAVAAGLVVGFLVIAGVEAFGSKIYPSPAGLDPTDAAALETFIAGLPPGAFLLVLAGWGLGALLGSWIATRLGPSRHMAPGLIVGAVLVVAGVANMMLLPHPLWFWAATLVVLPLFVYAGTRAGVTDA